MCGFVFFFPVFLLKKYSWRENRNCSETCNVKTKCHNSLTAVVRVHCLGRDPNLTTLHCVKGLETCNGTITFKLHCRGIPSVLSQVILQAGVCVASCSMHEERGKGNAGRR